MIIDRRVVMPPERRRPEHSYRHCLNITPHCQDWSHSPLRLGNGQILIETITKQQVARYNLRVLYSMRTCILMQKVNVADSFQIPQVFHCSDKTCKS